MPILAPASLWKQSGRHMYDIIDVLFVPDKRQYGTHAQILYTEFSQIIQMPTFYVSVLILLDFFPSIKGYDDIQSKYHPSLSSTLFLHYDL